MTLAVAAVLSACSTGSSTASQPSSNPSQVAFALGDPAARVVQSLVPHGWLVNANVCNTTPVHDEYTCLFETDDSQHEMDYRVVVHGSHFTATAHPGGSDDTTLGAGSWPTTFSGTF